MVPAGTIMVRTAQPLGTLAVYLLEPRSDDGLATWNFFDADLKPGSDFPVTRLMKTVPISLTSAAPLPENVGPPRPITFDTPGGGGGGRMRGGFAGAPRWLDGEHWLAVRDGRLMKVHAATGRSQPFVDARALAKGLSRLSSLEPSTVQSIAGQDIIRHGPGQAGFLVRKRTGPLLRDVRWLARRSA